MNLLKTTCQTAYQTGVSEHPRYFPRLLMTPDELNLEHAYLTNKLRRHNRLIHGWGVVCGAIVCRVPATKKSASGSDPCAKKTTEESGWDPWKVSVSPGYILGPYGDEIVIECLTTVDVRHACTTGVSGDPCPPPPDPWCRETIVEATTGEVYLAVRYKEILTRPVRVQPMGCGCDDTACEYSRIRDGYELCTLDACPTSHRSPPDTSSRCELLRCPPCPDEPWVVLAQISLDDKGIVEGGIDNTSCRRIVASWAGYWCRPGDEEAKRELLLERLALHVDSEGMKEIEDNGGDPRYALKLKACRLWGLEEGSDPGKVLAAVTVEEIAAATLDDWKVDLRERDKEIDPEEKWCLDLWLRAREVDLLTRPMRQSPLCP